MLDFYHALKIENGVVYRKWVGVKYTNFANSKYEVWRLQMYDGIYLLLVKHGKKRRTVQDASKQDLSRILSSRSRDSVVHIVKYQDNNFSQPVHITRSDAILENVQKHLHSRGYDEWLNSY